MVYNRTIQGTSPRTTSSTCETVHRKPYRKGRVSIFILYLARVPAVTVVKLQTLGLICSGLIYTFILLDKQISGMLLDNTYNIELFREVFFRTITPCANHFFSSISIQFSSLYSVVGGLLGIWFKNWLSTKTKRELS